MGGVVNMDSVKKYCLSTSLMLCLFLTLLVQVTAVTAAELPLKSRLGCVPFVAGNIEAMAFTEYFTTLLLNELESSGSFEVAERKRLEAAMDLEGLRSDALGRDQLQRLGGRLGVEYLVSGTMSSQPQGIVLEVHVLNLRGQQVIFSEKLRLSESEAVQVLRKLALRIRDTAQGTKLLAAEPTTLKPLASVTGLEASGTTNSIRLRWKHSEPGRVIGYMVLRGVGPQGPFNSVGTVTETSYADEQLRLNETYYYRITAVGHGGGVSEPADAVKGATSIAPAVPIFMNVEPLLGGAVLTWRQRPCAGGDEQTTPKGVRIYRRTASEKEFVAIGKTGDEPPLFKDQGLVDGTTYLYAMTAFNQAGAESEQSVQLSLATPPVTAGVTVTSGKVRRVPIAWKVHPFAGVDGYRVQRSTVKEGPYQEISSINDRLQTSYLDTGLSDKTTYWYRLVAASKEQGIGGPSVPMSATTRELPPTPLKLVAAQGEPRRVTLSWESAAIPDDELSGFYLYRGEPGQDKLSRIAELPADHRSYRDGAVPLKDATAYSYVVAAFNAGGAVSPLSARVTATTKAVPVPPQEVTASSGEPRRVTVRWKKNPEADVAEYLVMRQQSDGEYKQLKRTAETMLVDADLKDGASYLYRVQVVDRDGLVSQLSGPVKGTTKALPKAVDGVQLKDKATRLIVWQKSGQADVKRYNIYKKSFLGGQKLTAVETTEWRCIEPGKLELYVTSEDTDGLESEPSAVLMVE
jgi:fibronectin type 3 domain-containing protein/TolB-like protein